MSKKKSINDLMVEQLSQKNIELIQCKQELRSEVWSLRRMVHGLLSALNESEALRKKQENKGLVRI